MRKIIKREVAARNFNKLFANGIFDICGFSLLPKIDTQAEYFIAKADNVLSAEKYMESYPLTDNFYIYMGFFAARKLATYFNMPSGNIINTSVFGFLKGTAQSNNREWIMETADKLEGVNEDMFIKYLFDHKKYNTVRAIFEKKNPNYEFYLTEDLVKIPDIEIIKCILIVVPAKEILEKIFDFLSCNLEDESKYVDCINALGLDTGYVNRMAGYYGLKFIKNFYAN